MSLSSYIDLSQLCVVFYLFTQFSLTVYFVALYLKMSAPQTPKTPLNSVDKNVATPKSPTSVKKKLTANADPAQLKRQVSKTSDASSQSPSEVKDVPASPKHHTKSLKEKVPKTPTDKLPKTPSVSEVS